MKLKTFVSEIAKASVLGAGVLVAGIGAANAAEGGGTPHYPLEHPKHVDWSFAGPFGTWDKAQLQRGFKVYREVCSACHSLDLVSFRTLEDLGFSEEQVKAIASEYEITDGPNEDGEMFTRPGRPSDYFPSPFPNDKAAAYANNGAVPPDFSLIAKARAPERGFPTFIFDVFTLYAENGPDYLYSLLTGYGEEPPESVQVADGTYYNPYFSGGPALAMAQPIYEGSVTYDDGSPETVDQYSKDVSAFLMWAAEPMLVERKQMGFNVMIFLLIFASLLYFTKKKVWSGLKD
jgi:ubiquinol-cytochrome c reductase cytochrome c1 subunit